MVRPRGGFGFRVLVVGFEASHYATGEAVPDIKVGLGCRRDLKMKAACILQDSSGTKNTTG